MLLLYICISQTIRMNAKTPRLSMQHLRFIFLVGVLTFVLFNIARLSLIGLTGVLDSDSIRIILFSIIKNGLPFDFFVIAFYSAIPVLLFLISLWTAKGGIQKTLFKATIWYYIFSLPVIIILTIADIPYFLFFKNKLTESAFQWMDNPRIVSEMLLENNFHLALFAVALAICAFTIWLLHRKGFGDIRNCQNFTTHKSLIPKVFVSIGLITLTFLGMRGRIDHPLKEGDAFFSDNVIINQLALNPIFTLIKSYEAKADLMDDQEAITLTKTYLNIQSAIDSISPITRYKNYQATGFTPNVVLVIMESMSAAYMEFGGDTSGLTPHLNSLSKAGIMHNKMYSAGIHTNNGVFSTLYGFPAIKRTRPMGTVPLRRYSGIPFILKQNGYSTYFFTTHDKSFDNLGSFLPFNSFDKIYSQNDYDRDALVGPFGVADDYLFKYAVKTLTAQSSPFFTTILTSSNHDPYIIPKSFPLKYHEKSLDAVHYADWSIGQFMNECSRQPWYANTIFMFIADHGLNIGTQISGFALNYHHIPFIIYQPGKIESKQVNSYLQQSDVFPYLMSLLKLSYLNNTLGAAPDQVERDMIYFSSDDKLSALNDEWLYIYYYSGSEYLYKRSEANSKNYIREQSEIATKLRKYAFSQTQTADWLFRMNKTHVE